MYFTWNQRVLNPNGLLSPTLSSLWEEREKKLASGSPNLRFSPSIRLNLKAIGNQHGLKGELDSA